MNRAEANFASLAAYKFMAPFPFGNISFSDIEINSSSQSSILRKTKTRFFPFVEYVLAIDVDESNPFKSGVPNMASSDTEVCRYYV